MPNTLWILEATESEKFPYRLHITRDGNPLLRLWVQERWPGQRGNVARYGIQPEITGGSAYQMKQAIEEDFPGEFTVAMVREAFPDVPEATVQRVLRDLKADGIIEASGRGKKSRWRRII